MYSYETTGELGTLNNIQYSFIACRKAQVMIVAVIAPVVIITFLGVTFIFIPPGVGERSAFLSTLVLTEVMFLVMLTSFVPLSRNVPVIAFLFLGYLGLLVILSCFVIFFDSRTIHLKKMYARKKVVRTEISLIEYDVEKGDIEIISRPRLNS